MSAFDDVWLKTNWLSGAAVNNTTTDPEEVLGISTFAMEVTVTGGPTSCVVVMEGSIDGVNWLETLLAFNVQSDPYYGKYTATADKPVRYVRLRLYSLSGGTDPTVNVSAIGV